MFSRNELARPVMGTIFLVITQCPSSFQTQGYGLTPADPNEEVGSECDKEWGAEIVDPETEQQLEESLGGSAPTQEESYGRNKARLRMSIRDQCKRLGWVNAELLRLQDPHPRPVAPRRRVLRHRLQTMYGRDCLVPRRLRILRVKLNDIVRVKVVQLRRARQKWQARQEQTSYRARGPEVLAVHASHHTVLDYEQVDAMGKFWTGVWGVEGAYEEGSEALRQ